MQTAYSEVETGREELQKAEISQVRISVMYISHLIYDVCILDF